MDAQAITTAALQTLDEVGLEKLTMRAVARRLGVQVGGLYYHVADKAGLLRLMADRICAEIATSIAPAATWREAAIAVCEAARTALLAHRDGASSFAGAPLLASPNAFGIMETLMTRLAEGVAADRVGTCADTLLSYITGYVMQEQHEGPSGFTAESLADLGARFPHVFSGGSPPPSAVTFRASLEAILDGFVGAS